MTFTGYRFFMCIATGRNSSYEILYANDRDLSSSFLFTTLPSSLTPSFPICFFPLFFLRLIKSWKVPFDRSASMNNRFRDFSEKIPPYAALYVVSDPIASFHDKWHTKLRQKLDRKIPGRRTATLHR